MVICALCVVGYLFYKQQEGSQGAFKRAAVGGLGQDPARFHSVPSCISESFLILAVLMVHSNEPISGKGEELRYEYVRVVKGEVSVAKPCSK